MNKFQKGLTSVTKALVIALSFTFFSCSDDELKTETVAVADVETEMTTEDEYVPSVTLSGVHTVLASSVDCSACTFVVPEDLDVVDGKALGIEPGSVVCLKAATKYGNITFENMEGTEDSPITIGTCAN